MPMHRGHACATILFSYEYIPKPVLFYFLKTIFAFSRVRAVFIQIVSHNIHFGPLLLGVIGEGEREGEGIMRNRELRIQACVQVNIFYLLLRKAGNLWLIYCLCTFDQTNRQIYNDHRAELFERSNH